MDKTYRAAFAAVDGAKDELLEMERYIWKHPELGFREWKTQDYLIPKYEKLGLSVHKIGDIPGFYIDIDTGRKGPKVGVFGELDALCVPSHPESDPETGAVHACGHHIQSVILYGTAVALVKSGILDEMCGSIRLMGVPAEEILSRDFIEELKEKGAVQYPQGKQEFLRRGVLDGVDMALMIHTGDVGFALNKGCNGSIYKSFRFIGKTAHASGPWDSNNALYAANNALNAANALREVLSQKNMVRFHPIITKGGDVVNNIPDDVRMEAMVRGLTLTALLKANEKINRAYAAAAAGMGCRLIIEDSHGCFPRREDLNLQEAFKEVSHLIWKEEDLHFDRAPAGGVTDMGDVSSVMPICHAFVGVSKIPGHTAKFVIEDAYNGCVNGPKVMVGVLIKLLTDGGKFAEKVIEEKQVEFGSVAEYVEFTQKGFFKGEAVVYNDDGTVTLRYKTNDIRS